MNIRRYYIEIKNRFLLLSLAWVSVILVSYLFKEILLFLVTKQKTCMILDKTVNMFYFIFTDVTEIFQVYITLILFVSTQVFFLQFFYHFLIFIGLGLYRYEYNYLKFFFKTSLIIFFLSIIFFHKILLPFSLEFFLSFQDFAIIKSMILHFEAKLNEYLTFYIAFYYVCILYFQIFAILIVVFDYFKNNLTILSQFRKFLYYFFVILSTLVTPPDVSSQLMVSFGIIFSYEILVIYYIGKQSLKFL